MSLRISASLSPLQSPKSAILLSIRLDALIRSDDVATALRGVAAFGATRLVAAFLATLADFVDVLPAIVFTPGLRLMNEDGRKIKRSRQRPLVRIHANHHRRP